MSRLEDFLNLPNVADITEEIFVSQRLGTFKVKPMTAEKHKEFQERCRMRIGKKGEIKFDSTKFNILIVINQVIDPNLSNAEFLGKAGFSNPADFINAKFLPGEIAEIAEKVCEISGFNRDLEEDIEEAKN